MAKKIFKGTLTVSLVLLLAISFSLMLCVFALAAAEAVEITPDTRLYAGGYPFGVCFHTSGVLVVEIGDESSPAFTAGLKVGDIIVSVDGAAVNTGRELSEKIENCGGEPLDFEIVRGGEEMTVSVTPVLSKEEKYKCGMWVRDSAAGLGTVTFVLPEGGYFAGLGHGITDPDTGELMPLGSASVCQVEVVGVEKGIAGIPGELIGSFSGKDIGEIFSNTQNGVFGKFDDFDYGTSGVYNYAPKAQVRVGDAVILSTVNENGPREYKVRIEEIIDFDGENKNFVVKITDSELLGATGGIVQGMSGSPVLQNDKIIGALTHVFVNDPTKGYGIFIENMFSSLTDTAN